jgi:hypothetical protein
MRFKLKSVKVVDADGVQTLDVKVETVSGTTVAMSIPAKSIAALDVFEMDINREVKRDLRDQLAQLELRVDGGGAAGEEGAP